MGRALKCNPVETKVMVSSGNKQDGLSKGNEGSAACGFVCAV